MSTCPEGKDFCPCPEFSRGGLCDWPYRNGLSFQGARYMTEILQLIDKSCSAVVQMDAGNYRKEDCEHQD